jgi:hypothetical protein
MMTSPAALRLPELRIKTMILARTLASAIWIALTASVAVAQTGETVDRSSLSPETRMNMAVASHVVEYFAGYEGLLEEKEVFRLAMVAKMKAIALSCEGFDIDAARYNAVTADIVGPLLTLTHSAEAQEPKNNLPFTIAMSGYSMFLGGNLAVGAYDPERFCGLGDVLRKQMTEDDSLQIMIWADPE